MARAEGLVADYGEKCTPYDEMRCWEQENGTKGDAKMQLEILSNTIENLRLECARGIEGLERKTKAMIDLVSSKLFLPTPNGFHLRGHG